MDQPYKLAYGLIVIVDQLLDPKGRNPKDRACVVVTPTEYIVEGQNVDVVAITTRLPDTLPRDHVALPWHPRGHPRTGLNKRNAAVCSWLTSVAPSRIIRPIGTAPGTRMVEIVIVLRSLSPG